MKKLPLFALFFALIAPLQAQQGFVIGVQGGPQNSWIANADDKDAAVEDFKYLFTGGYAGMFKLGYNVAPPLGIHSGLVYSFQGQRNSFTDTATGTSHVLRRSLTYVKIPILLHLSTNPNAPATVVLEVGPQVSILQNAVHTVDGVVSNPSIDPLLIYEKNLLELTWGLGTDIRLGDYVCLSLMHRGDYSFFDVEDKKAEIAPGVKYYPPGRFDSRNLNLSFMAGFTFNFNIRAMNKYDKRLYWRSGGRRR